MSVAELRNKRNNLKTKTDAIFDNMQIIIDESQRVAEVAHNSRSILKNLDEEFEKQTGLNSTDVKFLFFATALQIGKWVVINKLNNVISKKIDGSRLKDDLSPGD